MPPAASQVHRWSVFPDDQSLQHRRITLDESAANDWELVDGGHGEDVDVFSYLSRSSIKRAWIAALQDEALENNCVDPRAVLLKERVESEALLKEAVDMLDDC